MTIVANIPIEFQVKKTDSFLRDAVNSKSTNETSIVTLNMRVHSVPIGRLPSRASSRTIQGVFRSDPERGQRIVDLLPELLPYQDEFLRWLSQSSGNRKLFVIAPVEALKQACNPPETLLDKIRRVRLGGEK